MNLAKITLRNNRTSLILYTLLLLVGFQTFLTIGRLEYPEFTIRNAQVITSYPGRTPIQVEQEVSEPLEKSLRQMAEVKEIKSTSKNGLSILSVELKDNYYDLRPIWQRMRNKVTETKLPDGAKTPSVHDEDFADIFPYIYAIVGDGYTNKELLDYGEILEDNLLAIEGVARVQFHGVREENIFIEFSSSELASYGFTPGGISAQIAAQNTIASSGNVLISKDRVTITTKGEFGSLDEIKALRFGTIDGETTVKLEDFATVTRGYKDPDTTLAHVDGERVITMAVSMVKGGVVTDIGDLINAEIAKTVQTFPIGVEVESIFFQPEYVSASISSFLVNLGQAFFFVVLVMLLFAGLRLSLVVGVLVPSAILFCFSFMPAMGVQLEMMSIAALIIALGLLVDNAVVVSEQILVRLSNGDDRYTACTEAVASLTVPLLASSATTIAAFSTVALAPGTASEFTFSLFAVVSMTLLCSWLLSITIIPLFCYYFLKPLKKETFVGRLFQKLYSPYEALLRWSLKTKIVVPAIVLALTILAGMGFKLIPTIFFPPNERGQFIADFELPLGTDILETEKAALRLETWMLENHGDELRNISVWIGNGGPRWYLSLSPEPANANYAFFNILTKSGDPADIERIKKSVSEHAAKHYPQVRFSAKSLESGPPVGAPIQIRIYGDDMETLYENRDKIEAAMNDVAGLYDIKDDWGVWVKQIAVVPDAVKASRLGFSTGTIADALSTQYSGLTSSMYREGEDTIPIVVRSYEDFRKHPERIRDMPIYGADGVSVPLGQIANIRTVIEPGSILRENTLRTMTIGAQVTGRFASEALVDLIPKLDSISASMLPGYHLEIGGEKEESAESQNNMASAMPIAFCLLSLVLISQFNSVRRFLVILLTIPPMIVGVVPGLLITGSSFGFMTMLGMIALLGIIVNNAILMIDEINLQWKDETKSVDEAIIAAALSRLRPIVLTTVTTIIGLVPLAISGGGMWSSMANAMMFGLGFGTILTLVLCPTLMSLFFRDKNEKLLAEEAYAEDEVPEITDENISQD